MTFNFSLVGIDQIINNAAKMRQMSAGQFPMPMVFRGPTASAGELAATHSQAFENWYANCPGLKVIVPSNPYDAKGLLKAAIRDNDPVIFMESEQMYGDKGEVPEGEYILPIGVADIKREGSDVTIVATGHLVWEALQAAEALEEKGIKAEVINIHTIKPLDEEAIFRSVRKSKKCLVVTEEPVNNSFARSLAGLIQEKCFESLDGPLRVIGSENMPAIPLNSTLEQTMIPNIDKVKTAIEELLKY
jgi:pyruvate dehydrogenase E1 component beta subunit